MAGNDIIRGFNEEEDSLNLIGIIGTISDIFDVSQETTVNGREGVLINTGGGNSVFLEGITIGDLTTTDIDL